MNQQTDFSEARETANFDPARIVQEQAPWFAAYTCAHHEKQVAGQLKDRRIECFLPFYRAVHRWKDRRKELADPAVPGIRLCPATRSGSSQGAAGARRCAFCEFRRAPCADRQCSHRVAQKWNRQRGSCRATSLLEDRAAGSREAWPDGRDRRNSGAQKGQAQGGHFC